MEEDLVEQILKNPHIRDAARFQKKQYRLPERGTGILRHRPVIIGMGPAGLFCGYYLAKAGYRPLLLERGRAVEDRMEDVRRFWETGVLNTESNVQFGEGGAGTFSDGKLNTLIKDPDGRHKEVLRCLVDHGAKPEILYENKPHLGTDVLAKIVRNMRMEMLSMGADIRFSSCVTDFLIEDGRVKELEINGEEKLPADTVVLAVGHSARDTFFRLYEKGIAMESKAFAVGVRIEHPQKLIDESQYGKDCPYTLPPADYKVTAKSSGQRGVYSFCMCPGGYVINASSEEGMTVVNGMSYAARDGKHANSAMIVTVSPEDYQNFLEELQGDLQVPKPLLGVAFQRMLERRAYQAGAGKIPVQRFADFRAGRKSVSMENIKPQTKGEWAPANVRGIFPKEIGNALEEGILSCGRKIRGFAGDDACLSGVESRTSSPLRILRDERLQASLSGLYPCGEGAGYAGGITSAAMDGLKVAEKIIAAYQPWKAAETEHLRLTEQEW